MINKPLTEEVIRIAYQAAADEQITLLKLEERHKSIAKRIIASRQRLSHKKNVITELHRSMSEPLYPVADPRPIGKIIVA